MHDLTELGLLRGVSGGSRFGTNGMASSISDLNPIEHLWDYLGREVAALNPPQRSLHELKQGLLCVWSSLPIPVSDNNKQHGKSIPPMHSMRGVEVWSSNSVTLSVIGRRIKISRSFANRPHVSLECEGGFAARQANFLDEWVIIETTLYLKGKQGQKCRILEHTCSGNIPSITTGGVVVTIRSYKRNQHVDHFLVRIQVHRATLGNRLQMATTSTLAVQKAFFSAPRLPGEMFQNERNFMQHHCQTCQMTSGSTATAASDVDQSGRPIFDDFFQHLWPYIGNNKVNVVFQMVKRFWLIRIDQ
ncbi:hypothetical protein TNCV_3340611 [Trichonephila clavipes]|nr:hypothetical protein TNCV_3340611 [Trichonephila clavipes]